MGRDAKPAQCDDRHPRHMQMQEVSRVLVTDGLGFWLFADISALLLETVRLLPPATKPSASAPMARISPTMSAAAVTVP